MVKLPELEISISERSNVLLLNLEFWLSIALQDLQMEKQEHSPSLDDCLNLLKGERDEQCLAGLLLVTKFCKGDDLHSLFTIYNAVGPRFIDRLLRTGMGKGTAGDNGADNRDAYLQLAVTVLAAFCRVPEIASSEDMVLKIPLILEIVSQSGSHVLEECYEFLYLVTASCEEGVTTFYKSGGMKVLASQMCALPDGSHMMELAMKITHSMLSKLSQELNNSYMPDLAMMVASISRTFGVLHTHMKFEALHLLSQIFSSEYSEVLRDALQLITGNNWSDYIRAGIVAILQNRVAPAEKLHALILVESVVSMLGEGWLIGRSSLADLQDQLPADRCLLLVLESSRVEIAVLLNEIAYLKYEASNTTSAIAETILSKQRNVVVAFSLIERIIKLVSTAGGDEGKLIDDSTIVKVINGLNETVNVVLEYLEDAKEHGEKKGDDLLASVRIVGSYLAETPDACKEKVRELLPYLLSIEGKDEASPFHSTCFLLPMLCQVTMNVAGSKFLISSGGYKAVVDCLIKLIGPSRSTVEDNGCIFLACDTIMNMLLKKEKIQFPVDELTIIDLLKALGYWAENAHDPSVLMMAASICALIFDYMSEEALLNHPNFDSSSFSSLARLIARSLACCQETSDAVKEEMDLLEIITAGYARWADRFPRIKETVEGT